MKTDRTDMERNFRKVQDANTARWGGVFSVFRTHSDEPVLRGSIM